MILKYYHLLHTLGKHESLSNQVNDEDCDPNMFIMNVETNKLTKELVNMELQKNSCYQMDVKEET
jgi:hypothetical protein